jgi:hypothetical protein
MVRWFGDVERRWVRTMLDTPLPDAERLPADDKSLLRRSQTRLTDPSTWRDLAYLMIAFLLGIVEFAIGVAAVVLVPMAIWVVPWIGWMHGELALSLLGPNRAKRLKVKAERLQAKSKFDHDPDAVRELIDEAHVDAKLAVSELRNLARGIYPAVLGDQGLDAALSAQAAKSPIPIDVRVTVESRPPAAVETTAYFIVGETLTNIAKHSGATEAGVSVWRTDETVVVEITDNGHGGAEIRPGGGLAGLADRAATIDGVITVVSPAGGPTVIRADLPCTW